MFQRVNCCPVFKSARGKIEYENCPNAIRIKDPEGIQHFYNEKDEPIPSEEFWCKSC